MSWRKGQAYGQDLRDRVLATPGVLRAVAERFGVSQAYVCRARARRERLGQTSPGAQRNHMPLRLAALEPALREQVAAVPAQTLRELCQWVGAQHGIEVGLTTMHKTLRRFGVTLKKNHPARSRANAARRRASPPGLDSQTTRVACRSADLS
jgi:transposase